MADYGMKISKAGYDVTDTDIKNLVLTSGKNALKIHATGTFTGTMVNGGVVLAEIVISHGLGYAPACLVYNTVTTSGLKTSPIDNQGVGDTTLSSAAGYGGDWDYSHFHWSDDEALRINVLCLFAPGTNTVTGRYYIFKEEAGD